MYKTNPYTSDPAITDILLKRKKNRNIRMNECFEYELTNFLKIKEITTEFVCHILDNVLSIRDTKKVGLTCAIVNRWFLYTCRGKEMYVIHRPSEKKDILYQIILGKSNEAGVYELKLKGKDISVYQKSLDGQNILSVNCISNYDTAIFAGDDGDEYSITRLDYNTDEEYMSALLEKNFITEEDIEIYYDPDPCIKDYVKNKTPKIEFL